MKAKLVIIFSLFSLLLFPFVSASAMGNRNTLTNEKTSQYVDSSVITMKVKTKLLANSLLKNRSISVTSEKGQVKLTGYVDTEAEKIMAGRLVKQVDGVTGVTNNIVVKKGIHR